MSRTGVLLCLMLLGCASADKASSGPLVLYTSAEFSLGETVEMVLVDGQKAKVKLVDLQEQHDEVNGAVRTAVVGVQVNGRLIDLVSGTYHLPASVGGVQIDCPITKGYIEKGSRKNIWGLSKDARLRVWPAESPWIPAGSFRYPARQRWFASFTHMGNEPVYVDGGDLPGKQQIYYHYGLDIGGCAVDDDVFPAP